MMSGVRSALSLYPLSKPGLKLIRQNENRAYYVRDGEREYLLRIHTAAEGYNTGILTGPDSQETRLEKELDALSHLRRSGMLVQEPVYSKKGRPYEILADGSLVSLLTWIQGETLGNKHLNHLDCLGMLAARIHSAAEGFIGGIRYDAGLTARMQEELDLATTLNHISQTDSSAGKRALEIIYGVIRDAEQNPEYWGFIHADLGFSNILLTKEGLVPIDFSLSGTGCLTQDIGMMLTGIRDVQDRRTVVTAYEKARKTRLLPRHLDAFFCLSILLFVCCQHQRLHQEAWYEKRMRFWSENYFEALAAGRVFTV